MLCGLMDKAPPSQGGDCGFESRLECYVHEQLQVVFIVHDFLTLYIASVVELLQHCVHQHSKVRAFCQLGVCSAQRETAMWCCIIQADVLYVTRLPVQT